MSPCLQIRNFLGFDSQDEASASLLISHNVRSQFTPTPVAKIGRKNETTKNFDEKTSGEIKKTSDEIKKTSDEIKKTSGVLKKTSGEREQRLVIFG